MVLNQLLREEFLDVFDVHQTAEPGSMQFVGLQEVFILEYDLGHVLNLQLAGVGLADWGSKVHHVELHVVLMVDGQSEESLVLHGEGVFPVQDQVGHRQSQQLDPEVGQRVLDVYYRTQQPGEEEVGEEGRVKTLVEVEVLLLAHDVFHEGDVVVLEHGSHARVEGVVEVDESLHLLSQLGELPEVGALRTAVHHGVFLAGGV